jgi:hypothetical protein
MGDVPFEDELETLVGNQFFPKHVAFFNCPSNTTFYSNSKKNLKKPTTLSPRSAARHPKQGPQIAYLNSHERAP